MQEAEDEFEQELRKGLRLREAPEGFAERVIAHAEAVGKKASPREPRPVAMPSVMRRPAAWNFKRSEGGRAPGVFYDRPALRWAIAATLLITMGLGGYAERQRQIAGERAREQVLLALRITGSTLRAVHDKLTDGND